MHEDAAANGDRVILVDDPIAAWRGGNGAFCASWAQGKASRLLLHRFCSSTSAAPRSYGSLDVPVRTLIASFEGH
jgi:hypothetical protein